MPTQQDIQAAQQHGNEARARLAAALGVQEPQSPHNQDDVSALFAAAFGAVE